MNAPLRRIKLKLFGHSQTGKSRLIQSLHSTRGITSSIIGGHSPYFACLPGKMKAYSCPTSRCRVPSNLRSL
ncbi:hypothetical protein ANCCEY_11889 [Ancylostoma ceylanicum]|uniref:Uncharacterized protein n=1 Tax=Ancylostoma ceylanicum TaxID=53326 RepID=A0A0D6LAG8_9BILA|nr:hypothetical protein ANCCEY_11889 [Ancylostoma ceylanicum]